MPEETYFMRYRCCNCGKEFDRVLLKGTKALGQGGECPHCGVKDYLDDGDDTNTHIVLKHPYRTHSEDD